MMKLRIILLLAALGCLTQLSAQTVNDSLSIVDHITADGVNTISQPEALRKLLQRADTAVADDEEKAAEEGTVGGPYRVAGYRVQVFSDNNAATARNEARAKSRNISERFPEMRTYVSYTSPYWRLKVGDFRTKREADDAAEEIRQAFPSYSKEIRVVRDRINVVN